MSYTEYHNETGIARGIAETMFIVRLTMRNFMFIKNEVLYFKQTTRVLCPDPKFTPWKYSANFSVGLLRYHASQNQTLYKWQK